MEENNTENPNFRLKAIAELLDGEHKFYIPSYQRGYRWNKKQVEDLLKDIWGFAKDDEKKKTDFYCLQPIVVKRNPNSDEWIVIDGQQRLTTLLLILNYIKKDSRTRFVDKSKMYEIKYATRDNLDFSNPVIDADIDSYHVFQAKKIIENWFTNNDIRFAKLEDVLFLNKESNNYEDELPQVKVIWYVADNESDLDSIKIFNNLNKGKISLTNAELIKALFILKTQEKKNDISTEKLNLNEFVYEWNEIENTLQDNRFWLFLSNKSYNPSTRIDIIFDFLTGKEKNKDSDYAYRKFQDLFDNKMDYWNKMEISNFTMAWQKVKEVFHTFKYWYEDSTLYHYIGFLIYYDVSITKIFNACNGLTKSQTKDKLEDLIKEQFKDDKYLYIDELTHTDNREECKKVLFFFNIQTCVVQQRNINMKAQNEEFAYFKFPFDLFKSNKWDIEHVGSKKENPLKEIKDKMVWLSYIDELRIEDNNWEQIKIQASQLLSKLKEKNKDVGDKFKDVYNQVYSIIQKDKYEVRDTIDNLTLLDAGTNRGYGNALFPTKRQIIIEKDTNGIFMPPCTRNLFLKYYSKNDKNTSQWKNTWNVEDRKAYLQAIHTQIDFILN